MEPHNYIEIDNCTSFNTAGRHGFIQLGRVNTAKITNNLFIDPIMLGSSLVYTDEQTQPDSNLHKVITLDEISPNTSLTISNNNIFWNQDVLDYWESNDSVNAPGYLSDLIMENLGGAASDAFFSEPLDLNSIPGTILEYVSDLYDNPAAEDMFDFIVEDISLAGTVFDSGNLFDFSTFDPCYDGSSQSATAGTHGGAVGAVFLCDGLSTDVEDILEVSELSVYPNPTQGNINIDLNLEVTSNVKMQILNMNGSLVRQISNQRFPAGQQQFNIELGNVLLKGIYLLSVQTDTGVAVQKIILQ